MRDLWTLRLSRILQKFEKPDHEGYAESQLLTFEPESGEEPKPEIFAYGSHRRAQVESAPVLVQTVATCYLGILLLKLPVGQGDLYRY